MLVGTLFIQVVTVGGVTICRVAAPIALLVVVLSLLRGTARLVLARPVVWASAYSLWAITSGLWSAHFDATMTAYGSLGIALAYSLAFATLLRSEADLRMVLYALSLVALGVGTYAVATSEGRAGTATGDANHSCSSWLPTLGRAFVRTALYAIAVIIIGAIFTVAWRPHRRGRRRRQAKRSGRCMQVPP